MPEEHDNTELSDEELQEFCNQFAEAASATAMQMVARGTGVAYSGMLEDGSNDRLIGMVIVCVDPEACKVLQACVAGFGDLVEEKVADG